MIANKQHWDFNKGNPTWANTLTSRAPPIRLWQTHFPPMLYQSELGKHTSLPCSTNQTPASTLTSCAPPIRLGQTHSPPLLLQSDSATHIFEWKPVTQRSEAGAAGAQQEPSRSPAAALLFGAAGGGTSRRSDPAGQQWGPCWVRSGHWWLSFLAVWPLNLVLHPLRDSGLLNILLINSFSASISQNWFLLLAT